MTVRIEPTKEDLVGAWTGHQIPVAVAAAVIASLLVACGGVSEQRVGDADQRDGDDRREEVSEQRVGDDGLRFFVHGPTVGPAEGEDAGVSGVLAAADGCVLLEEGGSRFPVVWPSGTSVAGTDPVVIALPSGEQVHLGDRVSGGGGYSDPGRLGVEIPAECLNEYGEVAVFNPDDDPAADPS